MLTKENNETISRIGPGTPMGEVMRRYWMPAMLSEELEEIDGPPKRVRLLGEDLVAWRDSEGKIGLMQNSCPHRGASMFFGRNEEAGLRCVYHGWKFDITGACVDMPNEPAESNFKHKIKATAYPAEERGGVIWAYMGPADKQPPLPGYEWARLPKGHSFISKTFEDCNWLQALEGGIDSSHSSFAHRTFSNDKATGLRSFRNRSTAPRLEVVTTLWGYTYASLRHLQEENQDYVRCYQFVMPFQQMRAGGIEGMVDRVWVNGHLWVPIDDYNTYAYNFQYARDGGPMDKQQWLNNEHGAGRGPQDFLPGPDYKLIANSSNDWQIDRTMQKNINFTGITGTNTQDFALQVTMGPVYDRTKEHLGSADTAIIAARRLLLKAVADVQAGHDPQGNRGEGDYARPAENVIGGDVLWTEFFAKEVVTAS